MRVTAYWEERVVPWLRHGRRLFVVAHGNSLRALFMRAARLDAGTIESFELPTGTPLICELDPDTLDLRAFRYL